MSNDFLRVNDVTVGYGGQAVLSRIDLRMAQGEFVALLGASGCGKSTLLRTVAGFVQPSAGSIELDGRDVTGLAPDRRDMALVFQSYALWPHMTVAQNMGYGLKLRGQSRSAMGQRVAELCELLGLQGLADRRPGQLSGGQRQRVALGRALAVRPGLLLLDEPMSNLDARIRLTVRHEISALQRRLGITALHVTHDREEAMVMADRIVVLDQGRIAQQGRPQDLYNQPATAFVAALMGADNQLAMNGSPDEGGFVLYGDGAHAPVRLPRQAGQPQASGPCCAHFRAEAACVSPVREAGVALPANVLCLRGRVEQVSYPGGNWRHAVNVGSGVILADAPQPQVPGTVVDVQVPASALYVFPPQPAGGPAMRQAA